MKRTIGNIALQSMIRDLKRKYYKKHLKITNIQQFIPAVPLEKFEYGRIDSIYQCGSQIYARFQFDETIPYKKYCVHIDLCKMKESDIQPIKNK